MWNVGRQKKWKLVTRILIVLLLWALHGRLVWHEIDDHSFGVWRLNYYESLLHWNFYANNHPLTKTFVGYINSRRFTEYISTHLCSLSFFCRQSYTLRSFKTARKSIAFAWDAPLLLNLGAANFGELRLTWQSIKWHLLPTNQIVNGSSAIISERCYYHFATFT